MEQTLQTAKIYENSTTLHLYLPLLSVLIPLNLKLKLPIKRTKLKHHKMTTLPINKKDLNSQEYNHANKTTMKSKNIID